MERDRASYAFAVGLAWVVIGCLACTHRTGNVNYRTLEAQRIFITGQPVLSSSAKSFGEVELIKRAWYFQSCDSAVSAGLHSLLDTAVQRGGNLVANVEFKGRKRWSTNPGCRRNLNYAWLIVPMFLPIPQSVNVRGTAIYDRALDP